MAKKEVYAQVLEQAEALFDGQRNWVCLPTPAKYFLFEYVLNCFRFGKLYCYTATLLWLH